MHSDIGAIKISFSIVNTSFTENENYFRATRISFSKLVSLKMNLLPPRKVSKGSMPALFSILLNIHNYHQKIFMKI